MPLKTKAIGIARQSKGDEMSKSVEDQTAEIRDYCAAKGWKLVAVHEERDVSGGNELANRPGLSKAVAAVEAGKASIIVGAYFDRLFREVAVQAEVVTRVEGAGGEVWTKDLGKVTNDTAASWYAAHNMGGVAHFYRLIISEKVKLAHKRLRAEGKWTGGKIPLGLTLDAKSRLAVDDATAPYVREAFKRRARGDTFEQVRDYLREATGLPFKSLIIGTQPHFRDLLKCPHCAGQNARRATHPATLVGPGRLYLLAVRQKMDASPFGGALDASGAREVGPGRILRPVRHAVDEARQVERTRHGEAI